VALAGNDNRPPPREPPAEAFTACRDKQAGDTCQVVMHETTIVGQCAAIPDGRLACRPDQPPPHRQPPAEAFTACKDKQTGDICQVVMHDATIAGQCAAIPDGRLACRPDQPPPREPPAEAFAACKDKQADNACSVKLPDQTIAGRCILAHDNRLFCLPEHMPQPPREE
jgi:hypothetical protein